MCKVFGKKLRTAPWFLHKSFALGAIEREVDKLDWVSELEEFIYLSIFRITASVVFDCKFLFSTYGSLCKV